MTLLIDDNKALVARVREMREQLEERFRAQAEQLKKLERALKQLRDEQVQAEEEVWYQFEVLGQSKLSSPSSSLEAVLAATRSLLTANSPRLVFDKLTEEACRMGVRAVAFEVRGSAAWAVSAHGFKPQLTEQTLRALVVPLSVDTPFRQVVEAGEHFGGNSEALKKNINILKRLEPKSSDSILLLPIRSAGAVAAVFYTDSGGSGASLPEDALELLGEFASAHLDRLTVLNGKAAPATGKHAGGQAQRESPARLEPRPGAAVVVAGGEEDERAVGVASDRVFRSGFDVPQLSEAERKIHRDATRLARLLVFEIALYNPAQVADGRKSKDLYKRLKPDIERSRQIFEQRFGKTAGKQFDYFYNELVRTLAGDNPSLLGSDCPGPSV